MIQTYEVTYVRNGVDGLDLHRVFVVAVSCNGNLLTMGAVCRRLPSAVV